MFSWGVKCTGTHLQSTYFLLRYCGIRDPSWAELNHFVNFLNVQLCDCEKSVFCDPEIYGNILQGFRAFAIRLMIQMSRVSFSFNLEKFIHKYEDKKVQVNKS